MNLKMPPIIIIAVILFQNDIRKALANLGKRPLLLRFRKVLSEEKTVDEIVKASTFLASRNPTDPTPPVLLQETTAFLFNTSICSHLLFSLWGTNTVSQTPRFGEACLTL